MEMQKEEAQMLQWHPASKHQKNALYRSVMELIVRANKQKFEEVKGMCDALRELMKDEIEAEAKKLAEERINAEINRQVQERLDAEVNKQIQKRLDAEINKQILKRTDIEVKKQLGAIVETAKEESTQATEKRINTLILLLSKAGRMDDIVKAAEDHNYQQKLFKEFGL